MKKFILVVFSLFICTLLIFSACIISPSIPKHECESVCTTCGGCLNEDCEEQACKDKCNCEEEPPIIEHECESVCEECGGCLNEDCEEEACKDKCTCKEEPPKPAHECESVCTTCGGCLNEDCEEEACKDKCTCEEIPPEPEHECESVCATCGGCLNEDCEEEACNDKCNCEEEPPIIYELTYISCFGGKIKGETIQYVEEGANGTLVTAVPNEGYEFVCWSDGVLTLERQDTNVLSNINVTAEFRRLTFNVIYETNIGGEIVGVANQTIEYGEESTKVTAIPDEGYKFVQWSDGVKKATRNDTNITSSITVTAEFEFLFAGVSSSNWFLIETYEQLLNMYYYPSSNYLLSCDLDLNGVNHEPIFSENTWFEGKFSGGGHTIRNLTIQTTRNCPSLFGVVIDGTISSLNIENVSITAYNFNTKEEGVKYYVGTVVGMMGGYIHDVSVSGKIVSNGFDYDYVAIGGLAGTVYGTVANCEVDIIIEVSNAYSENIYGNPFVFGGMVGVGYSSYMRDCSVEGKISVVDSCNYVLMGGMIGYYYTSISNEEKYIKDCTTDINITGVEANDYWAGGLIGRIDIDSQTTLSISNCLTYGDILNLESAGGFIYECYCYGNLIIENCTANNSLEGCYVAGFIIQLYGDDNVQIINCHAMGNYVGDSTGTASGFCNEAFGVSFQMCSAKASLWGRYTCGFGRTIDLSTLNCCFTSGKYFAGSMAAGFAFKFSASKVTNCYSDSIILKREQNSEITYLGGFAARIIDSEIYNSYFAGSIAEDYYIGLRTGSFIGIFKDSVIENCHVIHIENMNIVGEYRSAEINLDIREYANLEEMYLLAEKLNEGLDEEIWINVDNSCPQFRCMV